MARQVQEINAGSMADIAFLLLIFFLVTTTMDVDGGLIRKLPPMPEDDIIQEDIKVKERNIFEVLVNKNDKLLVENQFTDLSQLRQKAKEFIIGDPKNEAMPEIEQKEIPFYGKTDISKQIISLQNDRGTSYETYIAVQNELVAAYNEVREEEAKSKFGKGFDFLDSDQQEAVRKKIPQRISEAEPKKIGGK